MGKIQLTSTKGSWDHEGLLEKALAERKRFLEKYPEYASYQAEIDRLLDGASGNEQRMLVLALLIEGKLGEMLKQFKKLEVLLEGYGKKGLT